MFTNLDHRQGCLGDFNLCIESQTVQVSMELGTQWESNCCFDVCPSLAPFKPHIAPRLRESQADKGVGGFPSNSDSGCWESPVNPGLDDSSPRPGPP